MNSPDTLSSFGNLVLNQVRDGQAFFSTEQGDLVVSAYAEDCLRMQLGNTKVHDYGIVCAPKENLNIKVNEAEESVLCLLDGGLALRLGRSPLTFSLEKEGRVVLPVTEDSHFVRKFRLPPVARSEEGWFTALGLPFGVPVYGGGENYAGQDRRGLLIDMWNEDALGVNSSFAYKNCPFFWSPEGWGVFVNTPARMRAGVAYPQWSNQSLGLEVFEEALDIFFIYGDSPDAILERYTHLTGRSQKAPLWSLGLWLSKAYYRTPDETLDAAKAMRKRHIPCDVITLDGRAWQDTDTRFAFEWCPRRYDDPKAFCDKLKALDYKICVWEYPLISTANKLFDELKEKGWLLRDKDGKAYEYEFDLSPFGKVLTPLPKSGLLDFTNPDAYAFWRDKHFDLFKAGVDCIKSDFSEQVTPDMYAGNGDNGTRIHNVYTLLYNLCVYEACKTWFGENALVWARSGWAGSQRAPMQWAGDSQSSWSGLAASINGGLSWGMSGCPYYSSDIGGFYGEQPDAELFVRWTQAGALGSHMRFHGIGPREPWAYGKEAEAVCRKWIALRYRLIPYIQDACAQAEARGLPVMRAMALAFPEQRDIWGFEQQYMFGDSIFVAPVLQKGGKVCYRLPAGIWHDFWTGRVQSGGVTIEEIVSLDRIPLYIKDGALLKLGPAVQNTGEIKPGRSVEYVVAYGKSHAHSCAFDEQVIWQNRQVRLASHVRRLEAIEVNALLEAGI